MRAAEGEARSSRWRAAREHSVQRAAAFGALIRLGSVPPIRTHSRHPIDTPLLEGTSSGARRSQGRHRHPLLPAGFNAENSNQRRSSLAGSQKRASAQSKGLASIFHLRLSFLHPYDFPPHKRRALVYGFFGEQNRQNDLDVVVK